ncbi:MAG TPA: hypothetical protein VIL85_06520 [Thermomicrobiales bacterium]|jgi:hypothetical protein
MSDLAEARRRIRDRIVQDRPAAIAGPAPFWATLVALPVPLTTAALEELAEQGVVRRQPLGGELFYIADPPHAPQR